ncbi:Polyisoprenoid-binding protein YceI [Actinopolyspora xinjiangensis]|uniref:Polyisoprenoid-binding protein YceI n=1 Tax=Actinopolyspora xinjiangensis TaxID=405564 RepID=A0A1H0V4R4_9ACTN|nr:YceI family protein [Actinopolyspora xinjiangensis]SDP73549.1 Polyisoprenoid-binding protein YceI [Actinopolyspora xinjiangensis]
MSLGQGEVGEQHDSAPSGAVTARVRSLGGWPLPEAVLTVTDASGTQVGRAPADSVGAATVNALPPGRYTAIITALGHQPAARTALVRQGGTVELDDVELSPVGGGDELPEPGLWRIDPVHSSIRATARHLGISSIHGRFNDFGGEIRITRPVESATVEVSIDAASVDTGNAQRDEHLRSADFLDVTRYPEIGFTSTGVRRRQDEGWDLDGELTLCGVTRPVRLETRFTGVGPDPWGGTRASATATTVLRREDFAMTFNQSLSTGIAAIGTTLRIELDVQAVFVEGAN